MFLSERAMYFLQNLPLSLKFLNSQVFPNKTVAKINISPLGLEVLRNKYLRNKLELLTQAPSTQSKSSDTLFAQYSRNQVVNKLAFSYISN